MSLFIHFWSLAGRIKIRIVSTVSDWVDEKKQNKKTKNKLMFIPSKKKKKTVRKRWFLRTQNTDQDHTWPNTCPARLDVKNICFQLFFNQIDWLLSNVVYCSIIRVIDKQVWMCACKVQLPSGTQSKTKLAHVLPSKTFVFSYFTTRLTDFC